MYLSNHLRQNFLPNVCWFSITIILLLLFHVTAEAACTAGNPNSSVLESTPTSSFNGTVDDTVLHSLTGLVWDRCSLGQAWNAGSCTGSASTFNWQNALKEVKIRNDANHLGHSDWRLPNRDELHSIAEDCGTDPAINQTVFPNTSMLSYWSSSSSAIGPNAGWFVHFGYSGVGTIVKTNSYNVRLVRGGRSYDAFDLLNVKVSTSTSLNASPVSPVTFGVAVTLTAIVTGTSPTGTIQFFEDGNIQNCDAGNQTLVAGSATCILNALPAGNYNFSADYSGDSGNMSSSSDALAYVIDSGTPPLVGSVVATDVAQANFGDSNYVVIIGFSDADGDFDFSSIDANDITVCNGSTCGVIYEWPSIGDASSFNINYQMTPPGGSWDEADNGTYTISILANELADSGLNYVAANPNTGSFTVSIVDPTEPGPPVNVSGTSANTGALIAFDPPLSDGGSDITEYWATCNVDNTSYGTNSVESPILLTGLTNGVTYECYATARNSVGFGEISEKVFITPTDGGNETLPPSGDGSGEPVTFTHSAIPPGDGDPVFTYAFEGTFSSDGLLFNKGDTFVGSFTFDSTAPTVPHLGNTIDIESVAISEWHAVVLSSVVDDFTITGSDGIIWIGNDTAFGDHYVVTLRAIDNEYVPLPLDLNLNFFQLDLQDPVANGADMLSDGMLSVFPGLSLATVAKGNFSISNPPSGCSQCGFVLDVLTKPAPILTYAFEGTFSENSMIFNAGDTFTGSYTFDPRTLIIPLQAAGFEIKSEAISEWHIEVQSSVVDDFTVTGSRGTIGVGNDTGYGDRYLVVLHGAESGSLPLGLTLTQFLLDYQDTVKQGADMLSSGSLSVLPKLSLGQVVAAGFFLGNPPSGCGACGFTLDALTKPTPIPATLSVNATQASPPEPPPEADSLVAAIDISSTSAVTGYTLVVSFNIDASSRNEFTGFWKFGKEISEDDPHWYDYGTLAANGDGTGYELSEDKKTLTIYLIDGLRGDDDLLANGSIFDPALPIVEVSPTIFSNSFE